MKTTAYLAAMIALTATPLLSQAAQNEAVQRCMDAFVAQHFAGRETTFVVGNESGPRLPLVLTTGTRYVQLTASERATGRVLATANCAVRDSGVGIVSISALITER